MPIDAEVPVLDWQQFRDVTSGDAQLMRELLEILVSDTARVLPLLRDAIARRDGAECVKLAHYGRGGCANVGARAAFTLLDLLERSAAARDFTACSALLDRLPAELDRLRRAA